MRPFIRRHPFLILGLVTLGLFYCTEALSSAGLPGAAAAVAVPMRVLIVPMYLVWMPFTMLRVALAEPGVPPGVLAVLLRGVELAVGFAPYALADFLLARLRRPDHGRDSAT